MLSRQQTPGYAMYYVDCGPNGQQSTYDVRWNVLTIDAYTNLVGFLTRRAHRANWRISSKPDPLLKTILDWLYASAACRGSLTIP